MAKTLKRKLPRRLWCCGDANGNGNVKGNGSGNGRFTNDLLNETQCALQQSVTRHPLVGSSSSLQVAQSTVQTGNIVQIPFGIFEEKQTMAFFHSTPGPVHAIFPRKGQHVDRSAVW